MKHVTLESLLPEQPEFRLDLMPGKVFSLRLPDLDDAVWMQRNIGDAKAMMKLFDNREWETISRLAFHLMIDTSDFLPREIESKDDEGMPIKVRLTGPQLLRKAIKGPDEGLKLITAITSAVMKSNPEIDKAVRSELKKKILLPGQPAGRKSSTRSRASTATRGRKSAG